MNDDRVEPQGLPATGETTEPEKERRFLPPPQVVTCPNCDGESLRALRNQRLWVCDGCGYNETR